MVSGTRLPGMCLHNRPYIQEEHYRGGAANYEGGMN